MSYIFSKESFSYISGNGALHFSAEDKKIKQIHARKISDSSGNGNPKKVTYISGNFKKFIFLKFLMLFFTLKKQSFLN